MNLIKQQRYTTFSIVLHWIMFLLLIAVYSCIELREIYPKGTEPRELLKTWHFILGLSVFILVWVRLLARWLTQTPDLLSAIPRWQHLLAKLMHLVLSKSIFFLDFKTIPFMPYFLQSFKV